MNQYQKTRPALTMAIIGMLLWSYASADQRRENLLALSAMADRMETLVAQHGYVDALAKSCSKSRFDKVSVRLPEMLRQAGKRQRLRRLADSGGGSPWRSEKNCRCARKMVQLIGGNWQQVNELLLSEVSKADPAFAVRKAWTRICEARAGF
ncbi:MAG: hypothetical protein CMQ29_04980 [Gammaproteobacteria bacterium]|nr:hypothetical protein [Gammaproteobacteria bacterium]|tara:strand:+ start:49 stop:504 length:456 start_codon:yes stop_codon:yes gene_type:complete